MNIFETFKRNYMEQTSYASLNNKEFVEAALKDVKTVLCDRIKYTQNCLYTSYQQNKNLDDEMNQNAVIYNKATAILANLEKSVHNLCVEMQKDFTNVTLNDVRKLSCDVLSQLATFNEEG